MTFRFLSVWSMLRQLTTTERSKALTFSATLKPSRWQTLFGWLDSDFYPNGIQHIIDGPKTISWGRLLPFAFLHIGCLGVIWVGWSPVALTASIIFYFIRIFAITAFYHRYFSHRTYETSRIMQFLMGLLGLAAVQRGPLWWAAHHRNHHTYSDQPEDIHSPKQRGFFWSHMGWILCDAYMPTDYDRVKDLAKYPELVFLNRFDWLVPMLFGFGTLFLGILLTTIRPELGTSGLQMLVWGFFISTVLVFHATCTINSLSHVIGSQRFQTTDTSRNNLFLAFLTLGEGWHNNHHYYCGSVRQGFYWWEVDISYYILKAMSWVGLVWNLRPVPPFVYETDNKIATT